jgi:hypothetical protein
LPVSTFAWECRTKLAAAWNSGLAGDGMVHLSNSPSDSSSGSALPKPEAEFLASQRHSLVQVRRIAQRGQASSQLG